MTEKLTLRDVTKLRQFPVADSIVSSSNSRPAVFALKTRLF